MVDPTLFTVRPKCQKSPPAPTKNAKNVPASSQPLKFRPKVADLNQQTREESRDIMEFFALEDEINEDIQHEDVQEARKLEIQDEAVKLPSVDVPERDNTPSGSAHSREAWKDSYDDDSFIPLEDSSSDEMHLPN